MRSVPGRVPVTNVTAALHPEPLSVHAGVNPCEFGGITQCNETVGCKPRRLCHAGCMDTHNSQITPDQARAARALVQVSLENIAQTAGLEPEQIHGFEYGHHSMDPASTEALQRALEHYGAVFIPEDDQRGVGVRRKHNASKTRSLKRWENEGGPVAPDDF